jgi:hypothetical protein
LDFEAKKNDENCKSLGITAEKVLSQDGADGDVDFSVSSASTVQIGNRSLMFGKSAVASNSEPRKTEGGLSLLQVDEGTESSDDTPPRRYNRQDLRTMVKKMRASKLMGPRHQSEKRWFEPALSNQSSKSGDANVQELISSNSDARQSFGSRPKKNSRDVSEEKRMLRAMDKVVKRRLHAIEILEHERVYVEEASCCGLSLFGSCGSQQVKNKYPLKS